MVTIISRSAWGFTGWLNGGAPDHVPPSERTEFYVHYDGGTPVTRTGYAIPRAIDAEHKGNSWLGIGYNFVVSQAGEIFEGRGWDNQGAHCPDHNRSAIGVQIAIGGDQAPTQVALNTCRALYDAANARFGRTLAKHGHRDGFATDCPGSKLYTWVQAGMPATNERDDMLPSEIATATVPYYGPEGGEPPQAGTITNWFNGFTQANTRIEKEIADLRSRIDAIGQGSVTDAQLAAAAQAGAEAALRILAGKLG